MMNDRTEAQEVIVVRSLAESDLSLFAAHRESVGRIRPDGTRQGRQRAINLNAPIVRWLLSDEAIAESRIEFDVEMALGDVTNREHRLVNKSGKNWRLGGNKLSDRAFAKLDADDFMLLRSPPKNDGSEPVRITFVARGMDRNLHARVVRLVEDELKGSMAVFTDSQTKFDALRDCWKAGRGEPEVPPMPEPEEPAPKRGPPTVREKVRSPSIMGRMLRMAGELSAPAQVRFIQVVEELAEQMRTLLLETGGIVRLKTGHDRFWPEVKGHTFGFVDGGLANLSAVGSAPLAARVGAYVVTPGNSSEDREEFLMLQELIDDLFEHEDGGVFDGLFPDYGALRDAARISIEAGGAARLTAERGGLDTVMMHGALVNPVSRYSDLMSDGKVRAAFPGFSELALETLLPEDECDRDGRERNFISVYLRQLELLRQADPTICGVVEREGTTSTVSAAILDGFREEEVADLLHLPFEEWRTWYRRALRLDDDDDMEGQRITDSLLFRCVLREGEALRPVVIDRNELRRAPKAWMSVIARYPKPIVSFVQTSEWNAPVRVELFEGDEDAFPRTAGLVFHSSRLLPNYAFPAGLDIVDKFAHLPDWMSRPANTHAAVRALSIALEEGDHVAFDRMRRMLIGTGREWITRPKAFG